MTPEPIGLARGPDARVQASGKLQKRHRKTATLD